MAQIIEDIRLKRGNKSGVLGANLVLGEPAVAIDSRELYVGDGSGKVKISDMVVAATKAILPAIGEANKLYIVLTDETYNSKVTMYMFKAGTYVLVAAGLVDNLTHGDISDWDAAVDNRISLQKGNPDGLATLGTDGKIPNAQLPPLAIGDVYEVNNLTERDALTVQSGDMAVVLDKGEGQPGTFIYSGSTWIEMRTPQDGVITVNGVSGPNVNLETGDIPEGAGGGILNLYFTDTRARAAVINDSTPAADQTYSSNRITSDINNAKVFLGTKQIDESTVGNNKAVFYNATSGKLEYHDIMIDGGNI